MSKKSYLLAIALLLAVMAVAACGGANTGGSGDSAATTESGAAENVPASDADAANTSNDNSGAGDASGGNAAGDAGAAADVGSGSDGAAGSGGSNGASGATSPESDTGAPAQGDDTGNTESGTGGTADASGNTGDASGNTGSASGDAGNTAGTEADSVTEGGTGTDAATGTGGNNAQVATPAASYTAVSDAECTEIQGQLQETLGVTVNRTTGVASFTDLSGGAGESCQLTVTGTGADFASVPETAARISEVFTANGWTADNQYVADGPTGTIGGLRRDNQLAAYNVDWSPAAGVTCPADQPISACAETLTPEQMAYTITIDLAQQ